MADQDARFVGSIPDIYDRHMGPMLFEPYAIDLAQRLPPTAMRVLEIAAGTGRVTRHLVAALPAAGELVVTDLNAPMLEIARKRVGNDPRVRFQTADMQALPIPDSSVNAVVCQFGLMFVPDKQKALREMKRVLAPGGILLLSVWDDIAANPASKMLHELAAETFKNDPPGFVINAPFSMPQAHELERLATEAGLLGVRIETVAKTGTSESASHLAHGFVRGNPLWHALIQRGANAEAFERTLTARLAHAYGEAPCTSPMSAHVLTAWA
jgi:ubiquinone/menaquinone biosynthesis C-methylase UbiE